MESVINKFCQNSSLKEFKKLPKHLQIMLYKYAQYGKSMEIGNTLCNDIVSYYTSISKSFIGYKCGPECIIMFVYGTLLQGYHNNYHLKNAVYLGPAKTKEKYVMYVDNGIPSVNDKEKAYRVDGEIYYIKPDDTETIKSVDRLEGIPDYYIKSEITVLDKDGNELSAFIYFNYLDEGKRNPTGSYATFMDTEEEEEEEEEENDIWYFAYGSNMNKERLINRVGSVGVQKLGYINNYKLTFNKIKNDKFSYANIEKSIGERVYGILYKVSMDQIYALDRYEGVPDHYIRKEMKIYDENGKDYVMAYVYVANRSKTRFGYPPTQEYMSFLLSGAEMLPKEYYNKLKKMFCSGKYP